MDKSYDLKLHQFSVKLNVLSRFIRMHRDGMILKAIKRGIYLYRAASFDAFYIAKELYRKNRQLGGRKEPLRNFQYVFKENPHVAALSWIIQRKGEEVTAEFGKQVETFSNGFFEGVWSGDFKKPSTLFTSIRFGTGVINKIRI